MTFEAFTPTSGQCVPQGAFYYSLAADGQLQGRFHCADAECRDCTAVTTTLNSCHPGQATGTSASLSRGATPCMLTYDGAAADIWLQKFVNGSGTCSATTSQLRFAGALDAGCTQTTVDAQPALGSEIVSVGSASSSQNHWRITSECAIAANGSCRSCQTQGQDITPGQCYADSRYLRTTDLSQCESAPAPPTTTDPRSTVSDRTTSNTTGQPDYYLNLYSGTR